MHWLLVHAGITNVSGRWYGFWSGIGSDIGQVTLLGGGVALWSRHTCHVTGCHRWARHPVQGTPYATCAKHHPDVPDKVTPEHIEQAAK